MNRSGSSLWSVFWETNLLRPAVFVARVVITIGAVAAAVAAVALIFRTVEEGWARALMTVLALCVVAVLYGVSMVYPDVLWYVLDLQRAVHRRLARPAPRTAYPYLLIGSDLAKTQAVFAAGAVLLTVAVLLGRGAGLELLGGPGRVPPSWWRWWVGGCCVVAAAWLGVSFWRRVRAGDRSASARFFLAAVALLVLDRVLWDAGWGDGLVAAAALVGAAAAGTAAGRRLAAGDVRGGTPRTVVAVALLVPGIAAAPALRHVAEGLSHALEPWNPAGALLGLARIELPFSLWGRVSGATIAAAIVLGLLTVFSYWVRGDLLRAFLDVITLLRGADGPRSRRVPLLVVRVGAGILMAVAFLVVLAGGAVQVALRSVIRGAFPLAAHGGPGAILLLVGSAVVSVLATADVLQGAADVRKALGSSAGRKPLDFRWLKLFVTELYVVAAGAGILFCVLAYDAARSGLGPAGLLLAFCVAVAGLVLVSLFVALPQFLGDLLAIEAATREEGASRVRLAPGFPGFNFLIVWGRIATGVALFVGFLATALSGGFGIMAGNARAALASLIGGGVLTLAVAGVVGAFPDFLSLLLTIRRNVRTGRRLGSPADSGSTPEKAVTAEAELWTQVAGAIRRLGDEVVGEAVVPPADGVLLRVRGRRGDYDLCEEVVTGGDVEVFLRDPGGRRVAWLGDDGTLRLVGWAEERARSGLAGEEELMDVGTGGIPGGREGAGEDARGGAPGNFRFSTGQERATPRQAGSQTGGPRTEHHTGLEGPPPLPQQAQQARQAREASRSRGLGGGSAEEEGIVFDVEEPGPSRTGPQPLRDVERTPEVPAEASGEPPVPAVPVATPLRDVERTPEVRLEEQVPPRPSPGTAGTPTGLGSEGQPPAAAAPAFATSGRGSARPGARGKRWTAVGTLQVGSGGGADAWAVVALAELLAAREFVRRFHVGVSSERKDGRVFLLAGTLGPAATRIPSDAARSVIGEAYRAALGLCEGSLRVRQRWPAGEYRFVRDERGPVLAPGWVGGPMPPFRGNLLPFGGGRKPWLRTRLRPSRIPFLTEHEGELILWEVRLS